MKTSTTSCWKAYSVEPYLGVLAGGELGHLRLA